MDFIFYKCSGELHDAQDGLDLTTSIDPSTGEIYQDNFDEVFTAYSIDDIIDDGRKDVLNYLAKSYPDDLIKALKSI